MINKISVFNKINQTIEKFRSVTFVLEETLGIKFGYTRLYKNGEYYKLQENTECIEKIVSNVAKGVILCNQNISKQNDEFSFLLWPETPNNIGLEIFNNYGFKNAISLLKENNNFTDIYYFTGIDSDKDWHSFFLRNKNLLVEYIAYFENFRHELFIDEDNITKQLFKFKNGVDLIYPKTSLVEEENMIEELRKMLSPKFSSNLSSREKQIIEFVAKSYSAKLIANELDLSVRTIQFYIENIKRKLGYNTKYQLIKHHETLL